MHSLPRIPFMHQRNKSQDLPSTGDVSITNHSIGNLNKKHGSMLTNGSPEMTQDNLMELVVKMASQGSPIIEKIIELMGNGTIP